MKITFAGLIFGLVLITGCMSGGYWDYASQSNETSTQENLMSSSQVGPKVINYVNENLLNPQGVSAQLVDVSLENSLYVVSFDIIQSGVKLQSGEVYSTLDGEKVIIGTMFDTEQSLTDLSTPPEPESPSYPQTDTPKVELFVMSYCPYGNVAEEAMEPVAKLIGNYTDIQIHYVIYNSNYGYSGSDYCLDEENKYCSMHGIQELNQGVRELCAFKYQPDKAWDFVLAMNDQCNYQNADTCWQAVAESVGVNVNNTSTCEQEEALTILATEADLNSKYSVRGSPTLIINGVSYQGSRNSEGYKQAICSAFSNPPAECSTALSSEGTAATGGCG
jgi:hypothetical protein